MNESTQPQDKALIPIEYRLHFLFSLFAAIASVIIVLTINYFIQSQNSSISITYAPSSSRVLIDGIEYKNRSIQLAPGEHKITIEKYGFEPQTETINISAGETRNLYYALDPNLPITEDWYTQQSDDLAILDKARRSEAASEAEDKQQKLPILTKLPARTAHAYIGYGPCLEYDTCITIDAKPEYVDEAVKELQKLDGDLGRYHIIVRDSANPFKGEG